MTISCMRFEGQDKTRDLFQTNEDGVKAPEWVREFVNERAYDWFTADRDFTANALFVKVNDSGVKLQMFPTAMRFGGNVWIEFSVFVFTPRGREFDVAQYRFTAKLHGSYEMRF